MSVTKRASDAYSLFKKAKKIRTYGKLIKESVDENTRPGGLMKLGIRSMLEIAGKALGTSLTSHPYFTYHKVHLEVLAQALNASSNYEKALEVLNRAIRSADAVSSMTQVLKDYQARKTGLKASYSFFIAGSLILLRDYGKSAEALRQIQDTGQTPEQLKLVTDNSLYDWRAQWCELYLDSVQLLAMAQVEFRATEAAVQNFNQKMKALAAGGNLGRIGAYRVEQERQWQEYDRMTTNSGNARAVEDPLGFARDNVNEIEKVTDLLGELCEIAMGDDAYHPDAINLKTGSK